MTTIEDILAKHIQVLRDFRSGKIPFEAFAWQPEEDDDGDEEDVNELARYRLLIALQYDPQPDDEPLLRRLMEEEIKMHANADYQGLYYSLRVVASLLVRFRNPENIPLFICAKLSNFDTHAGFDYQYIISAGLEKSFEYVQTQSPDWAERFYDFMGPSLEECYLEPDELDYWNDYIREDFGPEMKFESIEDEIYLAGELQEEEFEAQKIREWLAIPREWNKDLLRRKADYLSDLDDIEGLLAVKRELLSMQEKPWDRVAYGMDLTRLMLENDNPEDAWGCMQEAISQLKEVADWERVGLGRSLTEMVFDIVRHEKSPENIRREAYQWGLNAVPGLGKLYYNLLEKITEAAEVMKDEPNFIHFGDAMRQERADTDAMLKRLKEL